MLNTKHDPTNPNVCFSIKFVVPEDSLCLIDWFRLVQSRDMALTSALSQEVIFAVLRRVINWRAHALYTILSSSHSYKSCFCLGVSAMLSAALSFSMFSWKRKSLFVVSTLSLLFPSRRPGQREGHAGIKSYFLSDWTSITQSSYSMRCSRQGVVSITGGIDTGELIKPKNDIST